MTPFGALHSASKRRERRKNKRECGNGVGRFCKDISHLCSGGVLPFRLVVCSRVCPSCEHTLSFFSVNAPCTDESPLVRASQCSCCLNVKPRRHVKSCARVVKSSQKSASHQVWGVHKSAKQGGEMWHIRHVKWDPSTRSSFSGCERQDRRCDGMMSMYDAYHPCRGGAISIRVPSACATDDLRGTLVTALKGSDSDVTLYFTNLGGRASPTVFTAAVVAALFMPSTLDQKSPASPEDPSTSGSVVVLYGAIPKEAELHQQALRLL